ncbi:DNA-primase RepB domain-containing protein [Parahaliea mediterranea]|uniref:DNA-primase RepB domain-containing protein n=1 Tax=Parahaliea mediterranea TaxID=651086 RepID=UPI000E2F3069|nr:DNA-primase RepB domain-containing protein [Parahaliea mediterranea]
MAKNKLETTSHQNTQSVLLTVHGPEAEVATLLATAETHLPGAVVDQDEATYLFRYRGGESLSSKGVEAGARTLAAGHCTLVYTVLTVKTLAPVMRKLNGTGEQVLKATAADDAVLAAWESAAGVVSDDDWDDLLGPGSCEQVKGKGAAVELATIAMTPADQLAEMFGERTDDVVVCRRHFQNAEDKYQQRLAAAPEADKKNVKRAGWPARFWSQYKDRAGDVAFMQKADMYFTVSLFEPSVRGEQESAVRRESNFLQAHIIGIDDVGKKIPLSVIQQVLPPPTIAIETSPGNQHWCYVLDTPCTDLARFKAALKVLHTADLYDKSGTLLTDEAGEPLHVPEDAKGVARLLRIVGSVNTKREYGGAHLVRCVQWNKGLRYSLEQLVESVADAQALEWATLDESEQGHKTLLSEADAADHPVIQALAKSKAIDSYRYAEGTGFYNLTPCINEAEHQSSDPTGAGFVIHDDGRVVYSCRHESCIKRGAGELTGKFLTALELEGLEDAPAQPWIMRPSPEDVFEPVNADGEPVAAPIGEAPSAPPRDLELLRQCIAGVLRKAGAAPKAAELKFVLSGQPLVRVLLSGWVYCAAGGFRGQFGFVDAQTGLLSWQESKEAQRVLSNLSHSMDASLFDSGSYRRWARRLQPDSRRDQGVSEKDVLKVMALVEEGVLSFLRQHRSIHRCVTRVDPFSDTTVLTLLRDVEHTVDICYGYHPVVMPVKAKQLGFDIPEGGADPAVAQDYNVQIGGVLDDLLDALVAARVAPDRKKAFVLMRWFSDAGKGFLIDMGRALRLLVVLKKGTAKAVMEGKPAPITPESLVSAFGIVFDEYNVLGSDIRELQNDIEIAPKYQMAGQVEVFLKLFFVAERVRGLEEGSPVEEQTDNRFIYHRVVAQGEDGVGEPSDEVDTDGQPIPGPMKLQTRPLYRRVGRNYYMFHLMRWVADAVNVRMATYRDMGAAKAGEAAMARLVELNRAKSLSGAMGGVLDATAYEELGAHWLRWLLMTAMEARDKLSDKRPVDAGQRLVAENLLVHKGVLCIRSPEALLRVWVSAQLVKGGLLHNFTGREDEIRRAVDRDPNRDAREKFNLTAPIPNDPKSLWLRKGVLAARSWRGMEAEVPEDMADFAEALEVETSNDAKFRKAVFDKGEAMRAADAATQKRIDEGKASLEKAKNAKKGVD